MEPLRTAGDVSPGAGLETRFENRCALSSDKGHPLVCDAIGCFFAIILLLAAGLKSESLLSGNGHISSVPTSLDVWSVVLTESVLAAWLISGMASTWARRTAITLLIGFIILASTRFARGDSDCGCFGRVHMHPAWTLMLDSAVLIALCSTHWIDRGRVQSAVFRPWLAGILVLTVPLGTGLAMHSLNTPTDDEFVPGTLADWHGQRFPLLDLIDPMDRSSISHGECEVILFDHTCPRCRAFLKHVSDSLPRPAGSLKLYAIDLAPESDVEGGMSMPIHMLRIRQQLYFAAQLPVDIVLVDGIVHNSYGPENLPSGRLGRSTLSSLRKDSLP